MTRFRWRPRGSGPQQHRQPHQDADDAGRALVEVIFLGVLLLIPVIYILIAVLKVQSATFAVNQAARDAGRIIDTAPSVPVGVDRARSIARIALEDQNVDASSVDIRFVRPGGDCLGAQVAPSQRPGDVYDVCVVSVVGIPGVPTVVTGSSNTVSGAFTLHVGDFREG